MCNIDQQGDVCDCMMQAIEISKEGDHKLDVAYLNETIYRTVQVARESAIRDERLRIMKKISEEA